MPVIVQYLTSANPFNMTVYAIQQGAILAMTNTQWDNGGGDVATIYGGLRAVNDGTISRLLDVNGLSWADLEFASNNVGTYVTHGEH